MARKLAKRRKVEEPIMDLTEWVRHEADIMGKVVDAEAECSGLRWSREPYVSFPSYVLRAKPPAMPAESVTVRLGDVVVEGCAVDVDLADEQEDGSISYGGYARVPCWAIRQLLNEPREEEYL